MYDVPEQEVNRREDMGALAAIRRRPIGLLLGERAILAWDAYPRKQGSQAARTRAQQHMPYPSEGLWYILRNPDMILALPLASTMPIQVRRSTRPLSRAI